MEFCLYHPELGYYMSGKERTGARGDYFTASDLHPVFARLIARQVAEMWDVMGRPDQFTVAELGAGRGLFAVDFLDWTRRVLTDFDQRLEYIAVEPSPRVRGRICQRLVESGLTGRARFLPSLEAMTPITGCFFSNELLDALPVAVIVRLDGRLKEIYVEAVQNELREKPGPISDSTIAAAVAPYAHLLEDGQRMEVSRTMSVFAQKLSEKLLRGFILTVDYGDRAENLYSSARRRGTLLAYRSHFATENFYDVPGEQDLTAHVNFSALIEAGKQAGLELAGFTTQERFLMSLGEANQFADLYDRGMSEKEKLQARLKLKRLLNPAGMGSTYKVLIQRRGVEAAPLTGLRYAKPWRRP